MIRKDCTHIYKVYVYIVFDTWGKRMILGEAGMNNRLSSKINFWIELGLSAANFTRDIEKWSSGQFCIWQMGKKMGGKCGERNSHVSRLAILSSSQSILETVESPKVQNWHLENNFPSVIPPRKVFRFSSIYNRHNHNSLNGFSVNKRWFRLACSF